MPYNQNMKLVINGDDLGYTLANTYGIIEAYNNGILSSTTALCNSDYLLEAYEASKDLDNLGIGVHLTLTLGKSLTDNKTLTDENGNFYEGRKTIWEKQVDYNEVYNEWNAQIEKFIEVFKKMPTHLDSHHSVHDANEKALEVSMALAKKYNLPLRRYSNFKFVTGFYGPSATRETLINILGEHLNEDIEIMCHPGYCDLELYQKSSYALDRVKELDVLCSKELKDFIRDNNIELVHY